MAQALSDEDCSKADAAALWQNAVDVLTPDEEEILVRFLWFGDRHEEIGAALGLSNSTVRSRYSRALEKLRQHFGARPIQKPGTGL